MEVLDGRCDIPIHLRRDKKNASDRATTWHAFYGGATRSRWIKIRLTFLLYTLPEGRDYLIIFLTNLIFINVVIFYCYFGSI